jgi:hypothetical protein
LGLESGETIRDRQELIAYGVEMLQAFLQAKSKRLFEHSSLRKRVQNFSYCFRKAFFQ